MTDVEFPPPGPARDRLVSEMLGWKWHGVLCWDGPKIRCPSLIDADALAALEAWRQGGPLRNYRILSPMGLTLDWSVTLFVHDALAAEWDAPTLCDAASAALARWALDRRQG